MAQAQEQNVEIHIEVDHSEDVLFSNVSGHLFYVHSFASPTYCSHCKGFIWGLRRQGLRCSGCSMSIHEKCQANVTNPCFSPKLAKCDDSKIFYLHHWVLGNVPKQPCIVCLKKVHTSNGGFAASQCSSCQKVIHNACKDKHEENGMGGYCSHPFGEMLFCQDLFDLENPPACYKPLLVFVNGKSGGQQGLAVLRKFYGLLSAQQVVSLLDEKPVGPGRALDAHSNKPNLHILVCGGDGTAAWVMAEMFDKRSHIAKQSWIPPIAVLPLGTGNDLARVLDWGGGYEGERLDNILDRIRTRGTPVLLDRWRVTITPTDESKASAEPDEFVLNNYFSIGLDAQIALQFHNTRESNPNLFQNRAINKGFYGIFGIQKFIDAPPSVSEFIQSITVDSEHLCDPETLNPYQCVVWQNIPSYGGGSKLWSNSSTDSFLPCSMSDNNLEFIGLKDIKHVLALQTKLFHGDKLFQGKVFHIKVKTECPVQIDGEPVLIGPSFIEIAFMNQATMLRCGPAL